jgi:hypothetical protein
MIQEKKYAQRLYYSSRLTAISIVAAYLCGVWDCFMLACLILFTSQMYWQNPVPGRWRTLDMVVVQCSLSYQVFYKALWLHYIPLIFYYSTVFMVAVYYLLARYQGRVKKNYDLASRCHMVIHVFGTLGNLILYVSLPR